MSKGGVGAEIILSAVMEGGGSGNKVSIKLSIALSRSSVHLGQQHEYIIMSGISCIQDSKKLTIGF